MILNVDGSSLGNPNVSSFCRLIQNADGVWIHSFASNIDYSNILYVELMTLYYGLCMDGELDIKDLMCYSDSNFYI